MDSGVEMIYYGRVEKVLSETVIEFTVAALGIDRTFRGECSGSNYEPNDRIVVCRVGTAMSEGYVVVGNITRDLVETNYADIVQSLSFLFGEINTLRDQDVLHDQADADLFAKWAILDTFRHTIETWRNGTVTPWKADYDSFKGVMLGWKSIIEIWRAGIDVWKNSIDTWKATIDSLTPTFVPWFIQGRKIMVGNDDNEPSFNIQRLRPTYKAAAIAYLAANSATSEYAIALQDNDSTVATYRMTKDSFFVNIPGKPAKVVAYEPTDSGWVTSGVISAKSGVAITSQQFRRIGNVVRYDVRFTANAYTNPPANGDIPNATYTFNIAAGWYPTSGPTQSLQGHGATGRMVLGALTTAGTAYIGSMAPGAVSANEPMALSGIYYLD